MAACYCYCLGIKSNDFFLKDNKKAFILWLNVPKVTAYVHRIQNEIDLKYIYSVLPYFSSDYITQIKQAVPGEALLFGNFVPMPLMVKIDRAIPDPDSKNCDIDKEWFKK